MPWLLGPVVRRLDLSSVSMHYLCKTHYLYPFPVGFAYPFLNFQLTTGICMIASSLLTFGIPHLSQTWSLLLVFVLNGICMGAFESGELNSLVCVVLLIDSCCN